MFCVSAPMNLRLWKPNWKPRRLSWGRSKGSRGRPVRTTSAGGTAWSLEAGPGTSPMRQPGLRHGPRQRRREGATPGRPLNPRQAMGRPRGTNQSLGVCARHPSHVWMRPLPAVEAPPNALVGARQGGEVRTNLGWNLGPPRETGTLLRSRTLHLPGMGKWHRRTKEAPRPAAPKGGQVEPGRATGKAVRAWTPPCAGLASGASHTNQVATGCAVPRRIGVKPGKRTGKVVVAWTPPCTVQARWTSRTN